jgi:hypothetical protein
MGLNGFMQRRALISAEGSLKRAGRLQPGERVEACAIGRAVPGERQRLDVVLTTEALYIGPRVLGSRRFPLAEIVDYSVDGPLRIVSAGGDRIDVAMDASNGLPARLAVLMQPFDQPISPLPEWEEALNNFRVAEEAATDCAAAWFGAAEAAKSGLLVTDWLLMRDYADEAARAADAAAAAAAACDGLRVGNAQATRWVNLQVSHSLEDACPTFLDRRNAFVKEAASHYRKAGASPAVSLIWAFDLFDSFRMRQNLPDDWPPETWPRERRLQAWLASAGLAD